MTSNELSAKLYQTYDTAAHGEKVNKVLLFGIFYSDDIKNHGVKVIVKQSRIPSNYATELSKAVKLSQYVEVKPNFIK